MSARDRQLAQSGQGDLGGRPGGLRRAKVTHLAKRFAEYPPDLADLCLIRMSELHPKHPVITVDGDFRVYRRNGREIIPLILPPGVP